MKSIKTISLVGATTSFLIAFMACALAQRGGGDDQRKECARVVALEIKRCQNGLAIPPNTIVVLDASGWPMQFDEFELPLRQIREDVSYLRHAASYLSNVASKSSELDFKAIARSTSEIEKRAQRLRNNLHLPGPDRKAERRVGDAQAGVPSEAVSLGWKPDAAQLSSALSALGLLIYNALRNPIIRGYLIDTTRSGKARSDLDKIIELAAHIKLSSEMIGRVR